MASEQPAESASAARPKGFPHLPCPICGQFESAIQVDLHDLHTFTCTENDCEFDADDVERIIGQWQDVLNLLRSRKEAN